MKGAKDIKQNNFGSTINLHRDIFNRKNSGNFSALKVVLVRSLEKHSSRRSRTSFTSFKLYDVVLERSISFSTDAKHYSTALVHRLFDNFA